MLGHSQILVDLSFHFAEGLVWLSIPLKPILHHTPAHAWEICQVRALRQSFGDSMEAVAQSQPVLWVTEKSKLHLEIESERLFNFFFLIFFFFGNTSF